MAVGVGVGAAHQVVLVPSTGIERVNQALHCILRRGIHADLAVVVDCHETPGGVDLRADHADVQTVLLVDERPVVHRGAAERVDAQTHAGVSNDIEVDDVLQVVHIVLAVVETLDELGLDGLFERHALDVAEVAEQFVRAVGDRIGHVSRSRAAGDRVVLEAAVGGRIVRRRHHDAVRQTRAFEALGAVSGTVVRENGLGDHRRGREVVARIDAYSHAVRHEHLDRGLPCRQAQGMGVTTDVERAVHAGCLAVFGDGLGDCDDVRLVERRLERRSAVSGGAEDHALLGNGRIRNHVVVCADHFVNIDQIRWGCGKSRVLCNHTFLIL